MISQAATQTDSLHGICVLVRTRPPHRFGRFDMVAGCIEGEESNYRLQYLDRLTSHMVAIQTSEIKDDNTTSVAQQHLAMMKVFISSFCRIEVPPHVVVGWEKEASIPLLYYINWELGLVNEIPT